MIYGNHDNLDESNSFTEEQRAGLDRAFRIDLEDDDWSKNTGNLVRKNLKKNLPTIISYFLFDKEQLLKIHLCHHLVHFLDQYFLNYFLNL